MIEIPKSYNYISAFLTFACNFKCHYCINKYNGLYRYKSMPASDWVKGLNRIKTRRDLPITITGGEPTLHPDFYLIVNSLKDKHLDLLTNGKFSTEEFMRVIHPSVFRRNAKYASIRFSYHPDYTNILKLIKKVYRLQKEGYSVGVWGVGNESIKNKSLQLLCKLFGIDFRLKEYLDKNSGTYKYPKGVDGKKKNCLCKPSELLIAPDGRLFRCHYDLYHGENAYGHILNSKVELPDEFLPCDCYGLCNPCDLKLKFDRFQKEGHCSVTIEDNNG